MKYLVLFTRQLAAMLRGGLSLVTALCQLEEVFPRKDYAKAAKEMALGLENGYSFYLLLQAHPRLFPRFYSRMVEAGEDGDSLLPALDTLADYYNEREVIKGRLARIMFYPLLLLTVAMASGLFALWNVVPTFSSLYASLGSEVPQATGRVFAVATAITPPRLIAGLIVILILLIVGIKVASQLKWASLAKLPLVGNLYCYWFCRITAMVTNSGHTLELALIMASAVSSKGPAPVALERLRQGDSLYAALEDSPKVMRSFIAQGEATGELPAALSRGAEYFRIRVEDSLDDFQRFLEPTAVLLVGTIVASMLLVLMLPMLQLARGF